MRLNPLLAQSAFVALAAFGFWEIIISSGHPTKGTGLAQLAKPICDPLQPGDFSASGIKLVWFGQKGGVGCKLVNVFQTALSVSASRPEREGEGGEGKARAQPLPSFLLVSSFHPDFRPSSFFWYFNSPTTATSPLRPHTSERSCSPSWQPSHPSSPSFTSPPSIAQLPPSSQQPSK